MKRIVRFGDANRLKLIVGSEIDGHFDLENQGPYTLVGRQGPLYIVFCESAALLLVIMPIGSRITFNTLLARFYLH